MCHSDSNTIEIWLKQLIQLKKALEKNKYKKIMNAKLDSLEEDKGL